MGSNIVVKETGNHAAPSADFSTISELLEVYDLSPLVALEWVWGKPNLRKILIKRAWREIVKSEYGKIGAADRNEKLSDAQRSELAGLASRARWTSIVHCPAVRTHTNGVVREEQVAN